MSLNRSPDTPTSAYQVNVNRRKTRKWVEAKVQNYDGDDWGGSDEYEDDDEPPPPPVPRVTTGLRPVGQRLPSESKPSARLVAAAAAGSSRSVSGPPSLRLQTGQQSAEPASASASQSPVSTKHPAPSATSTLPSNEQKTATPAASFARSQGPVPEPVSPVSARTSSPAPASAQFPPRKSSIGQQGAPDVNPTGQLPSAPSSVRSGQSAAIPRTASPAGHPPSNKSSPMVRPSELYRQDRSSTNSPHPSVDSSLTKPSIRSVSPAEEPVRQAPVEKDEEKTRLATQPALDSIAERKSEYALDKFPSGSQENKPAEISQPTDANKALGEEIDRKRLSVSPQLPDVARMSFFGPDLFASTTKDTSDAPPVPPTPTQLTKQEPPAAVSQPPTSGSGPPSVDRSYTSIPHSLPVSSIEPPGPGSSMGDSDTNKAESNTDSGSHYGTSRAPSDARSPAISKPLSFASKTGSQSGVSPISDQVSQRTASPAADIRNQQPNLYPASDIRSVPPLRTPSPNAKAPVSLASSHGDSAQQSPSVAVSEVSSSSQPPATDITPTEPLQPRRTDDSPIDFVPRPMQREPTISTVASSPVKESDVLSDEIMKSLSPVATAPTLAPPTGNDGNSLAPGSRGDMRVSTYTLSDYNDYWADTTEPKDVNRNDETTPIPAPVPDPVKKPTQPPALAVDTHEATTVTPNEPKPEAEPAAAVRRDSRRRFSWEASFDDKPEAPATGPAKDATATVPSITSPSPLGQSDMQSPKDFASEITTPTGDSFRGVPVTSLIVPASGGISHQVSKASTAHPSQQPTHMIEPPSPVSVMSERPNPPENRPVSVLQDDKQSSHTPTTPPPDDRPLSIPNYAPPPYQSHHEPASTQPAATPPASTQPKPATSQPVMGMRDIMNMQSQSQRLAKYEETRQQYADMDPGLQNWIVAIKNQHPEHATATSSFHGGLPASRQGLHTPSTSGSHPSSQQPYYQQYLNATPPAPNAAPPSGRSRLGASQGNSSTFGNSSNQIGTKSKEFMHSAGKMGKGLLSKGKSKLRGTGEKVFH